MINNDAYAYESPRDLTIPSTAAFRSIHAIYASIVLAVAIFVVYHSFTIILALFIGATIPILLFLLFLIGIPVHTRPRPLDLPRFRFVEDLAESKTGSSVARSHAQLALINDSARINSRLNSLIELVLKAFVKNWYERVSPSLMFVDIVRLELHAVVKELVVRVQKPDFAIRTVKRCIPAFRDHFDQFVKADIASREDDLNSDLSYQVRIARKYNYGKLHPALCHTESGFKAGEKVYLKSRLSKVAKLLLLKLSQDDEYVCSLVTEILACTISYNVISLLSDSDFICMQMISVIGDNLKHRGQVKQLRAALEQHSRKLNQKSSMMSLQIAKDSSEGITTFYTISSDVDLASVKTMIASISKIQRTRELNSILQYVISQLRAISVMPTSDISRMTMIERLQLLKSAIKTRQLQLHVPESALDMPDTFEFIDFLNDPRGCEYFSQHLQSVGRQHFLEFWKQVQSITVPLEPEAATESGHTVSFSLEFSTVEEIRRVYHTFAGYEDLVATDPESFTTIKGIVSGSQEIPEELFVTCRRALLKAQSSVFCEMDAHDLANFKKSSEFKKFEEWILSKQATDRESTPSDTHVNLVDPLFVNDEDYYEHDDAPSDVLESVESELSRIMQNTSADSKQPNKERSSISEKYSVHLDDSTSKGSLLGDPIDYCLFDDLSDVSDCDSVLKTTDSSSALENSSEELLSHVYHASPVTLNFAQEISCLANATRIINDQIKILQPLLHKAELTNNTPQLKILRRSLFSLQLEYTRNQLQMEQLVIQREGNSLFEKTKIWIQLYLECYEKGRRIISYVVEIQKVDAAGEYSSTPGWVLSRRFSQFYRLHEYLRSRYPEVAKLSFPKRAVHLLKTQQDHIIETRKASLELYLRNLIEIASVCDDAVFRSFLSCEEFHSLTDRDYSKSDSSASDSHSLKTFESLFQAVSQDTFTKMQRELHEFEDTVSPSPDLLNPNRTFVRPICDLLMSLFNLNTPRAWLRGRALVVLLQRVLGTTVDQKVQAQVENLLATESSLINLLTTFTNMMFPDGNFREMPPARTVYERRIANQEARALLHLFMSETCATIFGTANTASASSSISRMISIDVLNKQFVYQVLDIILEELFPEILSIED